MSGALLSVLANGLWQGALVTLAGALAARLLARRSAAWRYVCWCCVLAVAVLLPLFTTTDWQRDATPSKRLTLAAPAAAGTVTGAGETARATAREESRPAGASARESATTTIVTPARLSERVVLGYLLVVGLLLCVLVRDLLRLSWLRRRASALPLHIEVLLARCRRECGVRRPLQYGTSSEIDTPVFLGLVRPTLLLPRDSWLALNDQQLQQVAAHELAHAQRRDDWMTLVQRVVLALLFFNPAIRWLCARLSLEREMACDEWAVQHVRARPADFAVTMLQMAELAVLSPRRTAVATAFSGSCLRRRISWLISENFAAPRPPAGKRLALIATTFALVVFGIAATPTLDFVIPIAVPILPAGELRQPAARLTVDLEPAGITRRLNDAFDKLAQAGFNGAVLVARDDRIVLQRGFGVRDRRSLEPARAGTLFQAGAMAKMFTAAAVLRLEEQGKLKVDDLLSKWLGPLPAPKDQIRLHHLMVHTSGLTPEGQPVYAASESDFIAGLRRTPAEFAPGTSQRHSDIAYSALALVVQRASGMRYEEYVRKELLEPAGLRNTWFGDEAPRSEIATEYSETLVAASAVGQRRYVWGRRGAMAIVSNLEDLYRWERALRNGLFNAQQRTRMYDAGVPSLWSSRTGYGWETRTTTRNTIAHQRLSAWDGNSVELMRDERSRLTVVLFIDNRLDWDAPRYEAIARIALEGDPQGHEQARLQKRWAN